MFLLAAAGFLIALLPSSAAHARPLDSAAQAPPQTGRQDKSAGPKGSASGNSGPAGPGLADPGLADSALDNRAQIDALRKDLEARIDADRKEAAERINQQIEDTKDVLGALIGLTALASLIAGFLTYASVENTRKDAEKLVEYTRDEATRLLEDVRKRLAEIAGTFPEFAGLDERIRKQMREVESRMPPEADWNDDESFRALDERDKQEILDSEIAIAASVSVFALDRVPLLRTRLVTIYVALARFYLGRYNTSPSPAEGDYVRALSYATRVVQANPEAPGGYRLRGAIYLAHYYRGRSTNSPVKSNELLDSASKDLVIAVASPDPVDAGAFYNLALVQHFQTKTPEAVDTCRQIIGLKDKISAVHRKKYLPDVYRNLACFLALLADASRQNKAEADRLSSESVKAIDDGIKEFEPTAKQDDGLVELKKGIVAELMPGQNLDKLDQPFKDQIGALLTPAQPVPAPNVAPAAGPNPASGALPHAAPHP